MSLLKRIWHIQPSVKTFHQDQYQFTSGSNWGFRKKNMDQIRQENKLIALKMNHQNVDYIDYKKKLKEEIKSYIELRDGIRKIRDDKSKNCKSQKKETTALKLDKINHPKQEKDKNPSEKEEGLNPENRT